MTKRILVPFDESEPAKYALEEALLTFDSGTIIVLTVIETKEFTHGLEGGAAESVFEAQKKHADELFNKAQEIASGYEITLEHAVEMGSPGKEIVEYAEEQGIDHIVMGSHGRSGIPRLLLGSVAEYVLRNSPTSVMISRQKKSDHDSQLAQ